MIYSRLSSHLCSTLFFLLSFFFTACASFWYGGRDIYYRKSLESYRLKEKLSVGDSITVMFGDTIPFRYNRRKLEAVTGALVVTRNQFNKIEYYETGEWKYYWAPQFVWVQCQFDLKRGMYQRKIWNPGPQGEPVMVSESRREFKGDSLIDHYRSYYENGQLKENGYSSIHKGFHRKHRHWEKRTKIGTWTYYTEQGQVKKTKVYSK